MNPAAAAAHRSGARPGDAVVRLECDRRPREHHHEQILTGPLQGATGNVTFDVGTGGERNRRCRRHARRQRQLRSALLGGGGRHSGDVSTPEGEVINSQSRSAFGSVALSWTGDKGYFGGSYGYDDTKLGIPVVEGGILQSTPRKHSIAVRAGAHDLTGAFEAFRATAPIRRYKHEELEGEEVGTAFKNDTTELELIGNHRPFGRMKGSIGGWVLGRAFDAVGAEALSPAVDQKRPGRIPLRRGHVAARHAPIRRSP